MSIARTRRRLCGFCARRGIECARLSVEPLVPVKVAGDAIADNNDAMLETRCRSLQGRSHLAEQRRMNDHRDGTALLEKIRIVGSSQGRVGRHGDGANLHGTKECGNEFRGIEEDQQNAVSPADAKGCQRVPDAVDVLAQLPVGDVTPLGHDGQTIAAPFPDMAIDQIVREVVHGRLTGPPGRVRISAAGAPAPPRRRRCHRRLPPPPRLR